LQGIDTHAHVFSATARAVDGARYRPPYEAALADWRSRWAAAGITRGVLVQPSFFGTDNGEMLAAIASAPGILRGVAVVEPAVADADLGRLHAGGVRAIRLNLKAVADYAAYASSSWSALFERLHALGWHVEAFVDAARLPEIVPAFLRSRVAVVFDHFGNPGATPAQADATFVAVASLAVSRPVWVKFSGPYRLGGANPAALAARWLAAVGPARIVWGSDWPWTHHERENDYGRLRAALDDWVGPERARTILWDNAARLYGFA
jgi:predicted TIM-barrel fold metal-dependent hydrolase